MTLAAAFTTTFSDVVLESRRDDRMGRCVPRSPRGAFRCQR